MEEAPVEPDEPEGEASELDPVLAVDDGEDCVDSSLTLVADCVGAVLLGLAVELPASALLL